MQQLKESAKMITNMLLDDLEMLDAIEMIVIERIVKDIFRNENTNPYGLLSYEQFSDEQDYSYSTNWIKEYIIYFYNNSNFSNTLGTFTSLRFALIGVVAMHGALMNSTNINDNN